ncbi:serine/threonine-protein kinase-like protein At3g51990 [Rutidosis leptorrhynchoides]|uniref:serine/threonine-protein kinase-like protein At3g51990 n=1 Tax=Rutidosis leptorrhynchoides TaxID=125765 RepID=UPI003A9A0691
MGSLSLDLTSSHAGETILVVMDGNRGKGSLDALEWAIKYIVCHNETIVVVGVLPEIGKKSSLPCLPFQVGFGTSGIYIKLEFSNPSEMKPSELEREISRKKREYQEFLQPCYDHCKDKEVKFDIRLTAGLESKKVAVEEAKKLDPRWIVLDGYFKKDKEYIQKHVDCHLALLKTKGVATLIPSKITGPECEEWQTICKKIDDQPFTTSDFVDEPHLPNQTPSTPCSYPRTFSLNEVEKITDGFNNIVLRDDDKVVCRGVVGDIPVIVMGLPADNQSVSVLKIATRARHTNILSLIGYCYVDDSIFFLCESPRNTLEACLLCNKEAMNLSWNSRWGIAIEIGEAVRYLHEEFVDGSIVNLSLSSFTVSLSFSSSAKVTSTYLHVHVCVLLFLTARGKKKAGSLCIYKKTVKQVKLDDAPLNELHLTKDSKGTNIGMNEQLRADIKNYGVLLLELISGQSSRLFEKEGQCLADWALPFLEKNILSPLLDPRLVDTSDPGVANMARAALACLKNDRTQNLTISKVLAIVRGNQ